MPPESITLPEQTLSPLGEGAMARVYRADHPEYGQIAIKVLRHNSPDAWRRLQREAGAQARLDHPNIGRIFGFGNFEGMPAILMQRVDGRPLDEVAAELSLEARIDLLLTICDAVEHAHAAGLIHRDLKPANLLVEVHDGQLHPYVLDFGLAHDNDACSLTGAGELLGTPAYMSPEQARGDARHVDRRSDVFSLGAILFELLTGRPPFPGRSVSEVLGRILSDDAPLAHRVSRSVPLALSRICAQCLERDPVRRYPSAAALRGDLSRWLHGQAPQARAVGAGYRVARWIRRNRVAGLALAMVIAITLAALGWGMLAAREASRREQTASRIAAATAQIGERMHRLNLAPIHDQREPVAAMMAQLRQLQTELPNLRGDATARARHALAQAWLLLGEPGQVIALLEPLTDADADAHAMLGAAHLQRYAAHVAPFADRSPQQIDILIGMPGREARQRAESALRLAADNAPDRLPLALAQHALLRGDHAAALRAIARYTAADASDYDALALRARVLAEHARQQATVGELDRAHAGLQAAAEAFDDALAVGRSDAALLIDACRVAAERVRLDGLAGHAPPDNLAALSPACVGNTVVRPDRADGWMARSTAWAAIALAAARVQDRERERLALLAMREEAERAHRAEPDRPPAELLLARAEIRLAQLRVGDYQDTLDGYQRAIERLLSLHSRQPDYAPLLLDLGVAYRQRARLRVNFQQPADDDYDRAIETLEQARRAYPMSSVLADELSLTYVFAFYDARAMDPVRAQELGQQAIAVLDPLLEQHPDHPDLLTTQIANLGDLWSYQRSQSVDEPPAAAEGLRQRARALAQRLRAKHPRRIDGYSGIAMLELTAADLDHDRQRVSPAALREVEVLREGAVGAGLEWPAQILAWQAVENAREALIANRDVTQALQDAHAALRPALEQHDDPDALLVAQLAQLELSMAEVRSRQRQRLDAAAALDAGLALFERLNASARDLGDGRCDGGELWLLKAATTHATSRRAAASNAVHFLEACIRATPFTNGWRRPLLEQARAMLHP
jgi:serine/threonine-protein kinase